MVHSLNAESAYNESGKAFTVNVFACETWGKEI